MVLSLVLPAISCHGTLYIQCRARDFGADFEVKTKQNKNSPQCCDISWFNREVLVLGARLRDSNTQASPTPCVSTCATYVMGSFSLLPSTEHETGLHVQYGKSLRCCPYLPVTNVAFVWSPWNRFRTAWNMEYSDPRNRIKDLNKRS